MPAHPEALPVTKLLYETDAYLRDFQAEVVKVDGQRVALDQTAFYPGGAGQPADKGGLIHRGVVRGVSEIRRREGLIWHTLHGTPPKPGQTVLGHIDWNRRYGLMRTHTALHVLGAVILRDLGKAATVGDMKPLVGQLDFASDSLSLEIANAIESRVNSELAEGREVRVGFLPREEALREPDLFRGRAAQIPASVQSIRTVEIVGLDLQADGGTHVANTREIGPIRLVGYESKGRKSKRLRIELAPEAEAARAPAS